MANDFSRYAAKLRRIPQNVRAVQPAAAKAGAQIVRAEVETRAPVEDGDLKASIRDQAGNRTQDSARHLVIVGIFYARYVEYGHGGPAPAPAHPFFRPAFDHTEETARDRITKVQMDALRRTMT